MKRALWNFEPVIGLARVPGKNKGETSMRDLIKQDVHQVLREIALMELSLAKIGVESGVDIPMKIVILNEGGAAVLREEMSSIEEMIDHVSRSVDKGIVTAVVAVYKAKLAMTTGEEMQDMALDGRIDSLHAVKESVRDVVVCAVQYQFDGVGHTLAISAELIMSANGARTIGPLEFFAGNDDSGEGIPLSAELVFDTSKFLPWTEN